MSYKDLRLYDVNPSSVLQYSTPTSRRHICSILLQYTTKQYGGQPFLSLVYHNILQYSTTYQSYP